MKKTYLAFVDCKLQCVQSVEDMELVGDGGSKEHVIAVRGEVFSITGLVSCRNIDEVSVKSSVKTSRPTQSLKPKDSVTFLYYKLKPLI